MLVTTSNEIDLRRRTVARTPDLTRLGQRLGRLAHDLVQRPLYVPDEKALLSRNGGVCPKDGSRLTFDPFSPDEHVCPACGAVHRGERHHRAWVWRYHLWLTERAIHLALLDTLGVCSDLGGRAREIIVAYAERYREYPNRDNVLGPTRLFFSTYLESIWLVQLLIAASLLDWNEDGAGLDRLRAVADESAWLIASFDEGWSNRQVWNSTALVAAGRWLDDRRLLARGMDADHGVRKLLTDAVSDDARWHEGENYHLFALRGFLLAAELLRPAGIDLYGEAPWGDKLGGMYTAPLSAVLPDLTFPARGDSPFGVSLLQPRFAELWEIGWCRSGASQLAGLLDAMYHADAPEAEDHGLTEIAEVEQHQPARRMSRHLLGWKALLWMREDAPAGHRHAWESASVLVSPRGPAVLRSGANHYAALECGGTGTGHGHPDQLHLTLYWHHGWLMDFGTGSYVSESLHWYRSTLAHNAPAVANAGQFAGQAWCAAFDAPGPWQWCRGASRDLFGAETSAVRTVISGPEYVVDVLDVAAPEGTVIDLPLHPLGDITIDGVPLRQAAGEPVMPEEGSPDVGHALVSGQRRLEETPGRLRCVAERQALDVLLVPRRGESCFVARAPAPPTLAFADTVRREFLVRRCAGSGRWVAVFAHPAATLERVTSAGDRITVERGSGVIDRIHLMEESVRVEPGTEPAVALEGGLVPPSAPPDPERWVHLPSVPCGLLRRPPALGDFFTAVPSDSIIALGGEHYRRSEAEYPGEDAFGGRVAFAGYGTTVYAGITVRKPDLVFRAADAADPELDNEAPDIHSDGVQWYVYWNGWRGFVAIPERGGKAVRVRPVTGTPGGEEALSGTWSRTPDGYAMLLGFDTGTPLVAGDRFVLQLVINEMYPGRMRRAGQLALAGGPGWVYLRGDRESPATAVMAEVR